MFDIGFWELALIGVVALLVVGPERLPALARTVGRWVGKIRGLAAQVRDDIEREIRADELRKTIAEAEGLRDAYDSLEGVKEDLAGVRRDLEEADPTGSELAQEPPGQGADDGGPAASEDRGPAVTAAPAPRGDEEQHPSGEAHERRPRA